MSSLLTPKLYRSILKAARLCDANPGLRRHVISRLVRHRIAVGVIDSQKAVVELADQPGYSLVTAAAASFRQHLDQSAVPASAAAASPPPSAAVAAQGAEQPGSSSSRASELASVGQLPPRHDRGEADLSALRQYELAFAVRSKHSADHALQAAVG